MSLYVCTPRSSSTDLPGLVGQSRDLPYSERQPWLQFLRSDLKPILEGLQLLSGPTRATAGVITKAEARPLLFEVFRGSLALSRLDTARLLQHVTQSLVQKSLAITLGSEKMATQFFVQKSIDRIAAHFDLIIPESFPDENVQRVVILAGGSLPGLQTELLKILFYLLSNRLIMDSGWGFRRDNPNEEARELIGLLHLSGLTEPGVIGKFDQLSRTSPTMTAIIEPLFAAAVRTGAAGLVARLLQADSRIDVDRTSHSPQEFGTDRSFIFVRWASPLAEAVAYGFPQLAEILLDYGADVSQNVDHIWPLLSFAIFVSPPSSLGDLVQLLLRRGAVINPTRHESSIFISPLHAAIMMGNIQLIEQLVAAGADLNHRCSSSGLPQCLSKCIRRYLDNVGCLGLAASIPTSPFCADLDGQDQALELCKEIVTKYGPRIDLSDRMTSNAIIMAAAHGYTKVVSYLYDEVSADINPQNGCISPIYAAVAEEQVETCRQLLDLGASTHSASTYTYDGFRTPSILHVAASCGSSKIAELLLQHDAPVDEFCKLPLQDYNRYAYRWPYYREPTVKTSRTIDVSALRLAIFLEHWDVGLLLAKSRSAVTGNDLFAAAEGGNLPLVEQLLRMGVHPADAVEGGVTAYQTALSHGHARIASHLLGAGATFSATDSATFFKLPDIARIETLLPKDSLKNLSNLGRDTDGRTCLENAILSGSIPFITYVFSLDPTTYDSGALCAAVFLAIRSVVPEAHSFSVIHELLHRRDLALAGTDMSLALENMAVSLAVRHQRLDIVRALLKNHPPLALMQSLAVIPQLNNWSKKTGFYHYPGAEETVGEASWCRKSRLEHFKYWHTLVFEEVSPLFFAVQSRNEEIITVLLKVGYKPDGFILRAAIRRNLSSCLVERIIESCEDIDARCDINLEGGPTETPLSAATALGHIEIVKSLLAHGADVNAWGGTPLDYTPLQQAIMRKNLVLANLLLDHGAKADEPTWSPRKPFNTTPLQMAAEKGYIGLVRRLIAQGADVNTPRSIMVEDKTALEAAAYFGRLDVVQYLLDSGAHTEGYGRVQYVSATRWARMNGHGAVEALLQSHRPWTTTDEMLLGNRIECDGSLADYFIHPAEHSAGELVELWAGLDEETLRRSIMCMGPFSPRRWHKEVAILIKEVVGAVSNGRSSPNDVLEEAARIGTEAARKSRPELLFYGFPSKKELVDFKRRDDADTRERKHAAFLALREWASHLAPATESRDVDVPDGPPQAPTIILEDADQAMENSSGMEAGAVDEAAPDAIEMETEDLEQAEHISFDVGIDDWDWIDFRADEQPNTGDTPIPDYQAGSSNSEGHDETEEDQRLRAIRRDMLGIEEAPFFPTDSGV